MQRPGKVRTAIIIILALVLVSALTVGALVLLVPKDAEPAESTETAQTPATTTPAADLPKAYLNSEYSFQYPAKDWTVKTLTLESGVQSQTIQSSDYATQADGTISQGASLGVYTPETNADNVDDVIAAAKADGATDVQQTLVGDMLPAYTYKTSADGFRSATVFFYLDKLYSLEIRYASADSAAKYQSAYDDFIATFRFNR